MARWATAGSVRDVGAVAGWLAGLLVRGTGYGLVADLCLGIIGAFIGDWLLPRLGIHLGYGISPPSSVRPSVPSFC